MKRILLILLLCGCVEAPQQAKIAPSKAIEPSVQKHAEDAVENVSKSIDAWTGKVVGIVDGDTIDVLNENKETVRLRLHGIDTPERGQPFGNNAKQFVSKSIGGKMIQVEIVDEPDRYGRLIANVSQNGRLINLLLVKEGLAWHSTKYAPDRPDLVHAEKLARVAKLGLWGGSHSL